jgi:hypothetical protein
VATGIWLLTLVDQLGGQEPSLGLVAIYALGVVGDLYVIFALRRWRRRFDKSKRSIGASIATSTVPSSPVPRDSGPSRFRMAVVVVAGSGLFLAGAVLVLPGLVVFIDWIAGVFESAIPGAFCPPSSSYCTAASGKAGVLGLLAASVGVIGSWAGVGLLRKTRTGRVSSLAH